MSSDEVTDEEKETVQPVRTVTVKRKETVYKGHWKDKKEIRQCSGCRKSLNKIQSRHHCRICGDVYCYRCTRFSRRLLPDRIPDPDGKKYKVCRFCNDNVSEESDDGKTRSWTNEFHNMNLESKKTKREAMSESMVSLDDLDDEETDNRGILRVRSVRGRLIDVFHDDLRKPTSDKIMEKGKKAAKKGGFHRIFKRKRQDPQTKEPLIKICEDCKTNLSIDGIKRDCRVCGLNFCDNCCGKDVVLNYHPGENTDIYDPEIIIDGNDSEEPSKRRKSKRFRVCRFCRSQYQCECFLREVSNLTHILIQIQREINSIEEDEENEQEISKLQNEYMQYYRKVIGLQTNSYTQARLKQNVQNAMREFYIQHVSRDSIRLSRRNLSSFSEQPATEDVPRGKNIVGNLRSSLKKVRNRISRRQNSRTSMNDLCNGTSHLSLESKDNQMPETIIPDQPSDFPDISRRKDFPVQGQLLETSSQNISCDESSTSSQFVASAAFSRSEADLDKCDLNTHSNAVRHERKEHFQSVTPSSSCSDVNSLDEISQISINDSINSREDVRNSKPVWWRAVNRKLRKFRSVSELFASKSQTDLRSSTFLDESPQTGRDKRDPPVRVDKSSVLHVGHTNDNDSDNNSPTKRALDLQDDDVIMCDDYSGIPKEARPTGFSRVRRFRKSWRNAFRRISEKGNRLRELKILGKKSDKSEDNGLGDIIVYRTASLEDLGLYAMAN